MRADARFIDEQGFDLMNPPFTDDIELLRSDLLVALDEHFLPLRINNIVRDNAAENFFPIDRHLLDLGHSPSDGAPAGYISYLP